MTRLTKNKYIEFFDQAGHIDGESISNALYKLEKIEDIEELHEQLSNQRRYFRKLSNGEIYSEEVNHILFDIKNKEFVNVGYEPEDWLPIEKYGIEWALTEEELINDKTNK